MGVEIEDSAAWWIEITVDEPSDMDAKQLVLLGTDFQYHLNGRRVTFPQTHDSTSAHRLHFHDLRREAGSRWGKTA